MSEIWTSDELIVNMESFSDSRSEEDDLLSTWLSHTIQFDSGSTGIEYNISVKYEACEKPMEVYATIGAYSDVVRSLYVGKSPNYACSDGVSLPVKIGQESSEDNSVGRIADPKAISNYWQKDCISSCPSDQSRAISVSPSSSSSEKEGFHVRVHCYGRFP